MNILVTGSNGFIGSHVAAMLINQGHHVIGLGRRDNTAFEVSEYVQCEISSEDTYLIPQKINCKLDAVIHLAADMRHEPYTAEVVLHNCLGTQRLLEMCEQNSIKKFIQLSSLPVIGYPVEIPITEEHTLRPHTVYHCTKIAEEILAQYAADYKNIQTVSFRISAPVGARMNPKSIFPVFVNNALKNLPIKIYGKGTRVQTYVHVKDIFQATEKALDSNVSGVFNLSSFNKISNIDLAKTIIQMTNSKSEIIFAEQADPSDNEIWEVSLDKISKTFGYIPTMNLEDCITDYVNFIRG